VLLWKRRFLGGVEWLALVLVAAFGFDGAALWDLKSGNVAILEATLVWTGLACFVTGRRGWFAACIVAASLFKLAPIVFLALLLVPTHDGRPRAALLLGSLAAFAALVGAPFVAGPAAAWSGFATGWISHRPTSAECPGALAMLDAVAAAVAPARAAPTLGIALWGLYLAVVAWLAARWLTPGWRARDPRDWAMAAALLYVLVSPRPMAYGYVLAIAPALWFAPIPLGGPAGRLVLAGVLSAHGVARLASVPPQGVLHEQAPFLLLLGLWALELGWSRWARQATAAD
jgi:hypothetical protein